jgi:NADH-quinone oxidoreductase subunit H
MFFLAEYINVTTVSALATTLFLGGWRAPWPLSAIDNGVLNTGWWPILWFLGKVLLIIFFFYWLRATLPRLRYDQFMALGWKVLIPASLVWVMIVAAFRELTNEGRSRFETLAYVGIPLAIVVLAASFITETKATDGEAGPEPEPDDDDYPMPVLSGGRPVLESSATSRDAEVSND